MIKAATLKPLVLAGLLAVATPLLTGCEEEGPAEEFGEAIDETGEEAQETVRDAAD